LAVQDSADGSVVKELTLDNLKAFLDTEYDEIYIPAGALIPSETAGATAETVEYGTNDMSHDVMTFAGASADDNAEFDIVMPPSWDRSTVKYKLYWAPGHADANADEYVGFSLAAGARADDDALDAVLGTGIVVADQAIADNDLHITDASSALTVSNTPALGNLVHFKLTRDYDYAGAGAAMDVNAYVLGILIQYKKTNTVSAW